MGGLGLGQPSLLLEGEGMMLVKRKRICIRKTLGFKNI
jgi:hypothetical protein